MKENGLHSVIIDKATDATNHFDIIDWLRENFGPCSPGENYWAMPIPSTGAVEYWFSRQNDALAFKLTWQEKIQITYIDPPSGWQYGFPKVIPSNHLHRVEEWMVENGYPQTEVDRYKGRGVPYRCWCE
jgi:hypothetical protein